MKTVIKHILILSLLLVFPANSFPFYNKIDSLWNEYKLAQHDTTRIILLNEEIGRIYRNINPDSAIVYYKKAIFLTDNAIGDSEPVLSNENYFFYKATSLRYIGIVHAIQGHYDQSIKYFFESLSISEKINNKELMFHSINNIGVVMAEKGDYDQAVKQYHKSLEIAREREDQTGMSLSYINIGNVYYFQGDFINAIEYYEESLNISKEIGHKVNMSLCYNNIGSSHKNIGNYDQAIDYLIKSLEISEALGDKNVMAVANSNIAELNISLAESLDKSMAVEQEAYLNTAVDYGLKAFRLAEEINATPRKNEAARTLRSAYRKLGNYKKAFDYTKIFITSKDSMFHEEKTRAVAEIQVKYETGKKQQEIERQSLIIEKNKLDSRRQNLRQNSLIAGSLLLGLIAFVAYLAYRSKNKSNIIISEKKTMLEQAYEEIIQQNEELRSQSNELEKLNTTLNERIADELEKSRKKDFLLIQKSRQAAIGEMIANIAHQWRQPLNAVGIIIQNLKEACEYDEITKDYIDSKVEQSMDLIQYMSQTISDFRDFFKPENTKNSFDVKKAVLKSISFVEDTLKRYDIELTIDLEKDITVYGFKNDYAQVVLNLLNYSIDALLNKNPDNPKIEVLLKGKNGRSFLTIEDNGGGIPPESIKKIFDPYFSTQAEGDGKGLSLYLSKTIIEKHVGGSLKLENTSDGVVFYVAL